MISFILSPYFEPPLHAGQNLTKGGQRAVADRSKPYRGETSGIKSNVTHSVKLG